MNGFAKLSPTRTRNDVAPIRLEGLQWRNEVSQIRKLWTNKRKYNPNNLIKKSIIFIIIIFLSLIAIIQFPKVFIGKKMEYDSFIIYSNDEMELNEDVKKILDSVQVNLKKSQFYQEELELELYFVKGTLYERLIGLFGIKNIASSKFNKHIYIGKPNFKENILNQGASDFEWLNLVQIISHEGVHSQMYKDHSILGFMKTPSWINEGYSEYVSYRPIRNDINYNLPKLLQKYDSTSDFWVETEFKAMTPRMYLRDRILIEYLIDEKGMDILSVINDDTLEPEKLLVEIRLHFKDKNRN